MTGIDIADEIGYTYNLEERRSEQLEYIPATVNSITESLYDIL